MFWVTFFQVLTPMPSASWNLIFTICTPTLLTTPLTTPYTLLSLPLLNNTPHKALHTSRGIMTKSVSGVTTTIIPLQSVSSSTAATTAESLVIMTFYARNLIIAAVLEQFAGWT